MLSVYNTLTRKQEPFEPIHPPFVGMYVCGPTVYDEPHLGHGKSYVSFDVVVRFLRASGYKVRYVQNITDVGHLLGDEQEGEDRILKKARLERLEPVEVAQKYERHFFRDMDRLNCVRPDISCRATGHIPEMQELVRSLLEKGAAYEVEGNVYFDVEKFASYGKLSGKKLEDLKEGVRVEVAEGKRHPFDFALWKKADPTHLMQWNSPWGRGFPGWHLECSAMSMKYLGEHFDIHGGGLDNQFPHHECEIAQSEASTGKPFAKVWLHNNMVTVNGQKMSKSLGNFTTLDELFRKYDPMTIRFFILQGHYRSPQDFSPDALDAAKKGFGRLNRVVASLKQSAQAAWEGDSVPQVTGEPWATLRLKFFESMDNDFGTAGGISVLFDLAKEANDRLALSAPSGSDDLVQAGRLFRLLGEDILGFSFGGGGESAGAGGEKAALDLIVDLRNKIRAQKLWPLSDEIRDGLAKIGIAIEDGKDGSKWVRK
ncbi:cysteine--tRNA ligase [bacterium]|nr:cysteine--tRNA ligase [bacterium]